jgi:2-polyprenyl-3-methyl-5-hydroxy-6-metoxy-1,4-benzoquinol methylase
MLSLPLRQIICDAAFSSPTLASVLAALPRRQKSTSLSGSALWDRNFGRGDWDRLGALDELAHHAVIAGYVARLNPDGDVLDVGCGTGVTEKLLRRWCASYHGVDLSTVAVDKARAEALPTARFTIADAHSFVPDQTYDVIAMSEVAEYFTDLESQMRRYAQYLRPAGHIIVSMWVCRGNFARWQRIDRVLKLQDQTLMWNARRTGWMVKVYTL